MKTSPADGLASRALISPSVLVRWDISDPASHDPGVERLGRWFGRPGLAGVLLAGRDDHHPTVRDVLRSFRAAGHLLISEIGWAGQDSDGLVLDAAEVLAATSASASPASLVGVRCGDSQRLAIDTWAKGVDFVVYGDFSPMAPHPADVDLLHWWREMMTIPVAAQGADPSNVDELLWSGADLIIPGADLGAPHADDHHEALFAALLRHAI